MIHVIDTSNRDTCQDLLTSFFRLRHRVFRERLGWEHAGSGDAEGMELDEFDLDDSVYLVIAEDDGEVVAGLRLLRTTRTYLLGDRFASMIDGRAPRDEHVLEVTRLVVDPATGRASARSALLLKLVWGLQDFGLASGARRYVSLSYVGIERLLLGSGCRFRRLGEAETIGRRACVALSFEIAPDILESCANKLRRLGETTLAIERATPLHALAQTVPRQRLACDRAVATAQPPVKPRPTAH